MGVDTHRLVLYGNGKLAELLIIVLADDPRFEICAVTADDAYIRDPELGGLPVVPFDTIESRFPPGDTDMVLAVGYRSLRSRRQMFQRAKAKGYGFPNIVTRGARVFPDLAMGEGNIVFDQVYLGPMGRIGCCNVIRPQTYVGHEFVIGDHTFITSGVTIGGCCRVGSLTFIGLGTTIGPHTVIAEENLIAAASLVLKDTEPFGLYMGHPARKIREHRDTGVRLDA